MRVYKATKMSTKATPFSKRMSESAKEEVHNKELFLKELCNMSSLPSERNFFIDNKGTIRELIYTLRKHNEHSTMALLYAIKAVYNISQDEACYFHMLKFGVSSPLTQLLHTGPEEVKGEVSLCLYHFHSQCLKKQQSTSILSTSTTTVANEDNCRMPTIDSFLAHGPVMHASIRPLLSILHTHYPIERDPWRYSMEQQVEALDALLRYTSRCLKLTTTLVNNNAIHDLTPLLYSGKKIIHL